MSRDRASVALFGVPGSRSSSSFSRALRVDIEPNVVEGVVAGGEIDEAVEVLVAQVWIRKKCDLGACDDGLGEGTERSRIGHRDGGGLKPDLRVEEARIEQSVARGGDVRVVPRGPPVAEVWLKARVIHENPLALADPLQVTCAAALRDEAAAGTKRLKDAQEKSVVIGRPVECGGAKNVVESATEWV